MTWHSATEFLAMGGYAFYVWGAYAVTGILIAAEVWLLISRRRSMRKWRSDDAP